MLPVPAEWYALRRGLDSSTRVRRRKKSKRNRPRRDILEDLEAEGRTPEVVLLAWGIVEWSLNNAVLLEYGLSRQDEKAKLLLDLRVADKLNLQRKLGLLSEEEFRTVDSFRAKRNSLFHAGALFFPYMTEAEKKELTNLAIDSADIGHELSNRVYGRKSDVQAVNREENRNG